MSYASADPSQDKILVLHLGPEDAETEEALRDRDVESTGDEVTADDLADAAEDDEATSYRLADLPEPVRHEVKADPVWLALDRLVKGAMMTTRRLGSLSPT
jgi:hypothetical protein